MDRAKVCILAKGYRRVLLNELRADQTIQLECAPELRLQVVWPVEMPKGLAPRLELTPRNSYYAKSGIKRGKQTLATRLLWESTVGCSINADGSAVVRPAITGTHSFTIVIEHNGRTHRVLTSTRSVEVTGKETEAIVLEVREHSLKAVLQIIAKQ